MRAHLMYLDRDFGAGAAVPEADTLHADLALDPLLEAIAGGDGFLYDVGRAALMTPLTEPAQIRYRQEILSDCLAHPATVRALLELARDTVRGEREHSGFHWRDSPESTLGDALSVLGFFLAQLRALRRFVDAHGAEFASVGLTRLCATLVDELSGDYLDEVARQLTLLDPDRGTTVSARLGAGNRGTDLVLRVPPELGWRDRLAALRRPEHSFDVHPRDEASGRALGVLRSHAVNDAANALAQAAEHIAHFFAMLSTELGFYVGCLNLHERLTALGAPLCVPVPVPMPTVTPVPAGGATVPRDGVRLRARQLYEVSLALKLGAPAVGNDIDADRRPLIVITGANRGGKSTFLRSIGQAQLMMQAGMFVAAEGFEADVRDRLFTHFKREEDTSMASGKLDEELVRMSAIAERLTPGSELLCNESFASTNEQEGSEIARQVTDALVESGVRVVFVTHLFAFADGMREEHRDDALFLRAGRGEGGQRTYALAVADPEPTSYGQDTYRKVFDDDAHH